MLAVVESAHRLAVGVVVEVGVVLASVWQQLWHIGRSGHRHSVGDVQVHGEAYCSHQACATFLCGRQAVSPIQQAGICIHGGELGARGGDIL